MMLHNKYRCKMCGQECPGIFWLERKRMYMCASCMRIHNPPHMTLIKFTQGSCKSLWNMEVGMYETFNDIEEIEWCGWVMRSKQETLYNHMPRVTATIYHMEFFGEEHSCGRCVDYNFFKESNTNCLGAACKKLAKPFRPPAEIQYPPERSRYKTWMKIP